MYPLHKGMLFSIIFIFLSTTAVLANPPTLAPKEAAPATFDPATLPVKAEITGSTIITDARGRKVSIDLPVSRYALSTMDVIDYVIPLLGKDAFHKLVGAGQSGGKGIQHYSRLYTPIVGNYGQHFGQVSEHHAPFDMEMLLALAPDVLIVNSAMGAHQYALAVEKQLKRAGIKIVCVDVPGKKSTTSSQDTVRLLGKIFQKEERAKEITDFLDAQFAPLQTTAFVQRSDKPSVYYEMSRFKESFGPTQTSTSNGWGAVIAAAGGKNIADAILLETASAKAGGNTLDPEYILKSDPRFIILSGGAWMGNHPGQPAKPPSFDIVKRVGWDKLQAVQQRNIYCLSHDLNRTILSFYACQKLATIFYPDLLNQINPEAALDEFFQRFMLVDSSVTLWCSRYGGDTP